MDETYREVSQEATTLEDQDDDPTTRSSAEAIKRRMMEVAHGAIDRSGLAVSLDHLVMDDLVAEAGVARSSVRRIWPRNQDFFTELLVTTIDPDPLHGGAFDPQTLEIAKQVVEDNRDRLLTPDGRVAVLRETVRLGALQNYEALKISSYWQSFMALAIAMPAWDDEQRAQVSAALERVEERFITKMAEFYSLMLAYFVRRPREGIEMKQIVAAGAASVEGLIARELVSPDLVSKPILLPGLSGQPVEWHLAAIGFLGVIEMMTEPVSGDPQEYALMPQSTSIPAPHGDDDHDLRESGEI